MALAYGDTGGAKKNLIDSIINGTTQPPMVQNPIMTNPGGLPSPFVPGPSPVSQPTVGGGFPMLPREGVSAPPLTNVGTTPPTGGVNPFQLATGSSANPTVASGGGMGAMSNDFAAWIAQVTPDQMAQIGGPRNAFGYWLNMVNQSYAAATNTNLSAGGGGRGGFNGYNPQPYYPTHGSQVAPGVAGAVTQAPFTPSATPNYSGINPFLRYQTGNFGSPTNVAMRPGTTVTEGGNQGQGPGWTPGLPPTPNINGPHPAPPITHSGVTPRPIGGGNVVNEQDPPPSWMNSTLGGVPVHMDPAPAGLHRMPYVTGNPTGSLSRMAKGKKSRLADLTGFLLGY